MKFKCHVTVNGANLEEKQAMLAMVSTWHETLNRWQKNWRILSQVFRHHISLHGDVLCVCEVVTQLTIEDGELLFGVEYAD